MRSQTIRNTARFGSIAALVGLTFASAEARAADVNTGGAYSSVGAAELKYEHSKGLPTSIETGFQATSYVQVNVGVRIDPVDKGGPLFTVDMPKGALVEASWGSDKQIVLKAQNGSQTDGLVKVRHTLTPAVDFKFDGFGFKAAFSYNANDLLQKLPGAKFFYDSQAQQQFAPWGFAGTDTTLNAPALDSAKLFEMGFEDTPSFIADNVTGRFGVRATTNPTFSYKTTKIMLSGASGELTNGSDELTLPASDGDFMEIMTAVEGEMAVKGSIDIKPFVYVGRLGSKYDLDTELSFSAYSKAYTVPTTKVNFPTVLVHIPMPNVHVPSKGVDLGMVKKGGQATKTIEIENTGELEATMSFKSSDPQFQVPTGTVSVPAKSKYDLIVKFSPDGAGAAAAEITVASSDADSPTQTFKIGANGADVGGRDEPSDATLPGGPEGDNGCGCKAAGGSSSLPSWAGFGLAGLGAVVFFRRRRSAA